MIVLLLSIVLAFLIGSLPFSYWISKSIFKIDLLKVGSGNPGATNLYRSASKKGGLFALFLDASKGIFPVLVFPQAFPITENISPPNAALLIGVSAIMGHIFSPFLGFRGGKGVATSLGVFLALAPKAVGITFLICFPILVATRWVALASVTGSIVLPVCIFIFYPTSFLLKIFSVFIGVVIVIRHRSNIKRIFTGTETKI